MDGKLKSRKAWSGGQMFKKRISGGNNVLRRDVQNQKIKYRYVDFVTFIKFN